MPPKKDSNKKVGKEIKRDEVVDEKVDSGDESDATVKSVVQADVASVISGSNSNTGSTSDSSSSTNSDSESGSEEALKKKIEQLKAEKEKLAKRNRKQKLKNKILELKGEIADLSSSRDSKSAKEKATEESGQKEKEKMKPQTSSSRSNDELTLNKMKRMKSLQDDVEKQLSFATGVLFDDSDSDDEAEAEDSSVSRRKESQLKKLQKEARKSQAQGLAKDPVISTRCTIIADSMCKSLYLENTLSQVHRGARISDIGYKICTGEIIIQGFQKVIIHVGTNNIWSNSVSEIIQLYKALQFQVHKVEPRAIIIFSSIIPRLVDYTDSKNRVIRINTELQKLANSIWYCRYVRTYKVFMSHGQLIVAYFNKNDKLHLSDKGVERLKQYFTNVLSNIL